MLSALKYPLVNDLVADGFETILEDPSDVLRPEMNAVIMFMYKQRFFVLTVDSLIQSFHDTQAGKTNEHFKSTAEL